MHNRIVQDRQPTDCVSPKRRCRWRDELPGRMQSKNGAPSSVSGEAGKYLVQHKWVETEM